jgi:hypothetical protein
VPVKQRQRGLDEASCVESFVTLNARGECLDDLGPSAPEWRRRPYVELVEQLSRCFRARQMVPDQFGAHGATEKSKSKNVANRRKNVPNAAKVGKGVAAKKKTAKPGNARVGSMKTTVMKIQRRKDGPNLADILKAIRLAGSERSRIHHDALIKKAGLKVESFKREDGECARESGLIDRHCWRTLPGRERIPG